MNIKTVTVIGATGTMGANVAGIFASFGNAKVYCVGRDADKVRKTIPRIVKSVRADSIASNLIPADFEMLPHCIKDADLVFESVAEDIVLKKEIARTVSEYLSRDAVSCTGSSGLSISSLAECYSKDLRKRFFGVHMFNPPYSMPLCEFTSTQYSDAGVKRQLMDYLKNKLIRTVVEVKDSPAFLANRIGFQFINEAMIYADQYKDYGGIDYIDTILGVFTGRAMPPLATADFVGLDVHKAIVDNLYANTHDYAHESFIMPQFALTLVNEGKLGRKTGQGLYKLFKYDNGMKRQTVYDIKSNSFRDVMNYVFPFSEKMRQSISIGDYAEAFKELVDNHSQEATICLSFLLKYILYSIYSAKKVGYSLDAADDVMAAGFNWCPPLAMLHAFSMIVDIKQLMHERLDVEGDIDIDTLLSNAPTSKYDYRLYFRTGR